MIMVCQSVICRLHGLLREQLAGGFGFGESCLRGAGRVTRGLAESAWGPVPEVGRMGAGLLWLALAGSSG